MLIDDVKIRVLAGHGGRGAVAFNKNMMSLGPAGGSGGKGGSVWVEGVSDLSVLNQFRFKKVIAAEKGQEGRSQFRDGHDGKDTILKVPVGTAIHNLSNGNEAEITKIGERLLLAQGGKGGKGNFQYRSSTNTTPRQFQPGLAGEEFEFRLELKLIADVGFVGFPNVGKSSLLNELTNAKSKVANYPFTTLEPNLGVYYELILADIPGLIEGSSTGKGLGIKFLRHVERTKTIFHLISAESPDPKKDYETIRKELGAYPIRSSAEASGCLERGSESVYGSGFSTKDSSLETSNGASKKTLLEKPEYIFLSKSDMVSAEELKKKLTVLKKINPEATAISVYDDKSLEAVMAILNKIKEKKFVESIKK